MSISELKAARDAAEAFCAANLSACCGEVVAWRETGLLPDGRVRELALMCEKYVGNFDALRVAERMVEHQACVNIAGPRPDTGSHLDSEAGSANIVRRKAFICKSCEGVYQDEPVTRCDCMPDREEYYEGEIVYSKLAGPAKGGNTKPRAGEQFYGKPITADDIASFDEIARADCGKPTKPEGAKP